MTCVRDVCVFVIYVCGMCVWVKRARDVCVCVCVCVICVACHSSHQHQTMHHPTQEFEIK